MSFRFQRRVKILPGVSLNVGKTGASVSVGPRGMRTTIGTRGVKHSLGIPGTGIRYETPYQSIENNAQKQPRPTNPHDQPYLNITTSTPMQAGVDRSPKMSRGKKYFNLEYRYPQHTGIAAYPKDSQEICSAVSRGMSLRRTSSVFVFISMLGLASFFISLGIGMIAVCVFLGAVVFKIIASTAMGVRLEYKVDQPWRNYANMRMAPFLLMSKCKCLWEVTGSSSGNDRKYNAGCSVKVQRESMRVEHTAPFPFKPNTDAFTLYLHGLKYVFLPDCVYMIHDMACQALHYEDIKWTIGMIRFVESKTPADAQVVGQTWQYVNKKGGPDRRFSYNPVLSECLYGELYVNFSNRMAAKIMLSNAKIAKCIMDLPTAR